MKVRDVVEEHRSNRYIQWKIDMILYKSGIHIPEFVMNKSIDNYEQYDNVIFIKTK